MKGKGKLFSDWKSTKVIVFWNLRSRVKWCPNQMELLFCFTEEKDQDCLQRGAAAGCLQDRQQLKGTRLRHSGEDLWLLVKLSNEGLSFER